MPERFRPQGLPGLPGVALEAVQVSLQPLIRLLNVKTSKGFDLSSAIVPVVDVSRLIEGEAQAPKSLAFRAVDIPFRADNDVIQGFTVRASYTMKRPGRLTSAYVHFRITNTPTQPPVLRVFFSLRRPGATPADPDPPQANRAFDAPIVFAGLYGAAATLNGVASGDLAGPIALQAGDLIEAVTDVQGNAPTVPAADYRMFAAIEESVG